MDTPSADKPRRTRGGVSPHFGFRLDPAIAVRIDAIGAALAQRNEALSLPAPDRSDVMRAIVLQGLPPLEAMLGIASAPVRSVDGPAEHETPKAPPAAARASSGRGGGKAAAKSGKASKGPRGRG